MSDKEEQGEIHLRRILVPLDGSEWSFRAARYAIKIANMAKAEIVCVHAVLNLPYIEYSYSSPLLPRYIEDSKTEAQKWYGDVKAIAEKAGVTIVTAATLVNISCAADAIINYAENKQARLDSHGYKGSNRLEKVLSW